jgi:hypothetical protein
MDGFHIEGMAQDEGDTFFLAEIGDPVPGKDTFNDNDDVFPVGAIAVRKLSEFIFIFRCSLISLEYRRTFSLRAGRFHSNICVAWCRIA